MALLADVFNYYHFPGGRREFALKQISEKATPLKWTELAQHCALAVEHEQQLRHMKRRLAQIQKRKANPRLMELDPQIDRTVGSIYRIFSESANTLTDTQESERAAKAIERLFPNGARAITSLTFVDQCAEVESILSLLQQDYKDEVRTLGLERFVNQLANLNGEFRTLLSTEQVDGVTADQVRAADAQGQHNLLQAVAMILGRYPGATENDRTMRADLLRPIQRQNEAIRDYLRLRRSVGDVDPDTGNETPSETALPNTVPITNQPA